MSRVERSEGAVGTGDAWGGARFVLRVTEQAAFSLPPDKFDALLYGIQDETRKDGGMHLRCQKVRAAGRHAVASVAY